MILSFSSDGKPLELDRSGFVKFDNIEISLFKFPFYKRFNIFQRLLRLSPKNAIEVSPKKFLIASSRKIFFVDFKTKSYSILFHSRNGFSDPLNFCKEDNNIFWGDYGDNKDREKVNIYKFDGISISIVYSFKAGSIRHIHNIIYDYKRQLYWILTGDTETYAGIYIANKNWDVQPVVIGDQKYRAVVGFPTKNGLLYATDAVDEENYIYELSLEDKANLKKIVPINGSSIYGTEKQNEFVFSTTVEPTEEPVPFKLISYKLGKGIKDRYADIISINKYNYSAKTIARLKKDWLPMKLFQYGTVKFPTGQKNIKPLYFNPIALSGVLSYETKALDMEIQ